MADELKRTDILITGNEATWDCNLIGDVGGSYIGSFKFRCMLTPLQRIAASREMRELLGSNMLLAPEHEQNLAFALTQLRYRIVSAPPFWNTGASLPGDLLDGNIIMAVLDTSIAAELKYIENLKARKTEAIDRAKAAAEKQMKQQQDQDLEDEFNEED